MEEQWKKWLRENHPEHYQAMLGSLQHDCGWRDREIERLKGELTEAKKVVADYIHESGIGSTYMPEVVPPESGTLLAKVNEKAKEIERLKNIGARFSHEVEQTLAQAIGGFPWYKDDQKNFPGATEADGVCIGELVTEDIVDHAAKLIREHNASIRPIENAVEALKQIAIYDQDTRPLPNGTGSFAWDAPFDWRRRSMKQEDLARAAWKAFHESGVLPTKPATDDELMRLSIFMPVRLHAATKDVVIRFASALADKLHAAEKKYGYSDNWKDSGWMNECREHLLEHLAKGDPRDVANFCMFLWHHGEKTSFCGRDWYDAVLQFHKKFGQLIGERPSIPSEKVRTLRVNLIAEEAKELELALLSNDMPEIADACADLIYVIVGTAISYGIDLRPVFSEVQRTNMLKEGGGERGDGKILKPAGWKGPRIIEVLVKQGWQPETGDGLGIEIKK